MRATKKPITIDFIPYERDNDNVMLWIGNVKEFQDNFIIDTFGDLFVKTLEGTSYEVTTDDMIIRGVNGEYYPCKKDIFYKTYDVCQ